MANQQAEKETLLSSIASEMSEIQRAQAALQAKFDSLERKLAQTLLKEGNPPSKQPSEPTSKDSEKSEEQPNNLTSAPSVSLSSVVGTRVAADNVQRLYNYRIILTTYPGQVGVNPMPLDWGNADPRKRGPVVASRHPLSLKIRNAIGAYSGSYAIYRALAIAIGDLNPDHRPDYHNTYPAAEISPNPTWFSRDKIVSLDPWGHLVQSLFEKEIHEGLDARPTIAITKAHVLVPEVVESIRLKRLIPDGKIVLDSGDMNVTKIAVDPVWYLPGVARRFKVSESVLRRCLFEDTGGMYPELITRPDLKLFLPPIGGITVYILGKVEDIQDPSKEIAMRVHDECNGSDVFGSDICTCRPYLVHALEECAKTAQKGGVGIIAYFRKEGRALGEVTKYLVYNARKRGEGGDLASNYFRRTENIAGVKDMRFQALMPDIIHWLGITRIDYFHSMSNMKYDAMVEAGIKIIHRCSIPDELIPPDSKVEIEAKIQSGYFSEKSSTTDISQVKGRNWDDLQH